MNQLSMRVIGVKHMPIVGGKAIGIAVYFYNDSVRFIRKLNYTNKSSDLISFGLC